MTEASHVQAVVFDLDGTLVDSNGFHVEAWAQAFGELGIELAPHRIAGQIGKGGDLLVPSLAPDLPKGRQQHVAERHGEIFKDRYLAQVGAFPGATELVHRVAGSGRKVALASSASQAELDHYIGLLGIADVVAAITSIDDVGTSKPASDVFTAVLAKLGVSPQAACAVGDTPYDAEAAGKAGLMAVAVRSGGFPDAVLTKAGAAAIYDDVQALFDAFDGSPLAR